MSRVGDTPRNIRKNILLYRHELKFEINRMEKDVLAKELGLVMASDAHAKDGRYMIRSLYFDDWANSAYEEKQAGVASRKKYRIRIYDYSDSVIKLERKRKEGQYIYKEAESLTKEETLALMAGNYAVLADREEALCRDFYQECQSRGLRPRVIVDYDREPYVYANGDVRITFDMGIRAGLLGVDIFDRKLPVVEVMQLDSLIMEVKYTQYLPDFIKDVLRGRAYTQIAASKYAMCVDKHRELLGF